MEQLFLDKKTEQLNSEDRKLKSKGCGMKSVHFCVDDEFLACFLLFWCRGGLCDHVAKAFRVVQCLV